MHKCRHARPHHSRVSMCLVPSAFLTHANADDDVRHWEFCDVIVEKSGEEDDPLVLATICMVEGGSVVEGEIGAAGWSVRH
jgi:hypothetical protein